MKLTKKLKAEILEVHNAYWGAYLKGNVGQIASLLADDYTQVGSAETEVFNTKKGAVKFLRDTIKQVAGKLEMRNRNTGIEPLGNDVLIHELCDVYVLADAEWTFYSKFRASTFMRKEKNRWKIVHQHSSFPDARTGEGENIATEKIAVENRQLREAVKRRTVELEHKSRELEIEAALERVRAIAMGMKDPADMLEVCRTISLQMQSLGVKEIRNVQTAIFYESRGTYMNYEYYSRHKKTIITETTYTNHKVHKTFATKMLKGKGEIFITHIKGKKVKDWIAYQKTTNVFIDRFLEKASSLNYYWHSLGPLALGISTYAPLGKEELSLFKRFLNVFELAYTRFLDIEQALAQSREARIEAALERVRSRTMAMHRSDELSETSFVLFTQLKELGEIAEQISIGVYNEGEGILELYATIYGNQWKGSGVIPYDKHVVNRKMHAAWKEKKKSLVIDLAGEELDDFNRFKMESSTQYKSEGELPRHRWVMHVAFFSKGMLSFSTHEPRPPETIQLLERFAGVFDLTYTRFLDLQKAEAQAREAQIEVALERIRARAMAMHTSDELMDVAGILREQMGLLGQPELETSVINLFEENSDHVLSWHAFRSPELSSGTIVTGASSFPWDSSAIAREMMGAYRSGQQEHTMEADGAKALELFQVLVQAAPEIAQYAGDNPPERVCYHLTYFSGGALLMVSYQPPSEEAKALQRRAATVFDLAYRRYRDLKKAEAQTREATIEASLEKVRGKAMAMHTSSDISETMGVVFSELPKLGISSLRCGVALFSKGSRRVIFYAAANALEGDSLTLIGTGEMSGHPEFENQYEYWLKQEDYFVTLSDQALRSYYEALAARLSGPYTRREHREQTEHGYYFPFSAGNFYAWSVKPYPESEIDILQRFKAIIDLTFRRYLDLQKAEAQAREAQIEASLERVRSRTLAMQKSDELAETAAVLFRQLITLGIETNRLYIAIMKDESGNAEFWITDEDGSKVGSGFAANLHGNHSLHTMFTGWQDGKKSITIDMQGKELQEYFQYLSSLNVPFKGGLSQTRRVQNIAYFSRGFIGMASPDKQPEETTTLLERFAAVFNLTLTRFNDLKLAEAQAHQAHLDLIQLQAEKKRAEDALSELSATQAQLIQQEKLASLGQLTAGIAHEIKNPLNFVNNFSSLSVELLDEAMQDMNSSAPELRNANVSQLLGDIKTNLTKIIEHGTRADGIVKSMLQHSRGGSGKKEPVDLNALVKEYVNLAFHGMRAGKNPINVDISLDLRDSVGKVPIIVEDFSRVIINLCQNAFDAMREKMNAGGKSYLPKLTVRTRREADKVIVEVGDNGPGIPNAIKDKILHPFFTTKKGTQGTGLGLSITNDIVKAHGGELMIETKEGQGSSFIIRLPANS